MTTSRLSPAARSSTGRLSDELAERQPTCEQVTVVIPTLGRPLLEGCLASIFAGTCWPEELIVVDQSPDQKAAIWLERLAAEGVSTRYIPSSQTGVAAARNRGIEQVASRFLVITDDDCRVEAHWLERMKMHLNDKADGVITDRVDAGGEGPVVSTKSAPGACQYTRPPLHSDVLFAGSMGCARAIFEVVGLFDESEVLRYAEDNDWSYRALRSGLSIFYCPDVALTHLDWRDEDQLNLTYRAYARSQAGFFGKHLRRGDLHIALRGVIALMRALVRWGKGLLTSNRDLATNGRAFATQLVPGLLAGLRAYAWRAD